MIKSKIAIKTLLFLAGLILFGGCQPALRNLGRTPYAPSFEKPKEIAAQLQLNSNINLEGNVSYALNKHLYVHGATGWAKLKTTPAPSCESILFGTCQAIEYHNYEELFFDLGLGFYNIGNKGWGLKLSKGLNNGKQIIQYQSPFADEITRKKLTLEILPYHEDKLILDEKNQIIFTYGVAFKWDHILSNEIRSPQNYLNEEYAINTWYLDPFVSIRIKTGSLGISINSSYLYYRQDLDFLPHIRHFRIGMGIEKIF